MERRTFGLGLLAVATIAISTASAQAQTTANGPYYAVPSWDQSLPANARFIILSNMSEEAVLDRETGLVWERAPQASAETWFLASLICLSNITGGREGWRLATVQELASLKVNAQMPADHPFTGVQNGGYWSATSSAIDASTAWVVFPMGGRTGRDLKTTPHFLWCVRGGQGVDPQ